MALTIVKYGHPVLRQKGAKIERITPEIEALIDGMFKAMYAAKGVGLAAQQVGHALQLTVLDVAGIEDRPSTLEIDGKAADVDSHMPLVLVNPQILPLGAPVKGAEGCLSFPEIYADITRPEKVEVRALDRTGQPITFRCGGLLAKAVQHEFDHLQGILFIDRMDAESKDELRGELAELQANTRARLKK